MRIRGGFIIALLIVVGIVVCLGRPQQVLRATVRMLRDAPSVDGVSRSQTYPLHEVRWLRFRLTPNAKTARVVTNANLVSPLPPLDEARIRPGWRYVVEYKVVGEDGGTLTQQLFHFRTQVTLYEDLRQGGRTTSSLLTNQALVPADARSLRVPLEKLPGDVAELHLRVSMTEAPISDVAVRVACLEEREDHDDPLLWRRLDVSRIESIFEDSVYPADLLAERQRQEILHWRWRPLSPVGVEGRDYQRRLLYVYDADRIRGSSTELSSSLPIVQHDKRIVFRVPDSEGRLRLSFDSFAVSDDRAQEHPTVTATWHAPTTHEKRDYQWPVMSSDSQSQVVLDISGGKLELLSTRPAGVQAFWETANGSQTEIDLEPLVTRTYPCGPGTEAGLLYRISHLDERPTPFRVKFRRQVLAHDIDPSPVLVTWELLGAEGHEIESGVVEVGGAQSAYDWIEAVDLDSRISEPTTRYWEIAPNASAIRFTVEGGERVFVAASNRPPGLARKVELNNQSVEYINSRSLWQTWFELRPKQHAELCRLQQTCIVQTQTRPPQLDKEILENRYQWESFQPSGDWTGRYLFLPRGTRGLVREEAIDATFSELPINKNTRINVLGQAGDPPDVSLALVRATDAPADFTIRVDDGETSRLAGTSTGTIELGAMAAGPHSIRIDCASPLRAFVNHSLLDTHEISTLFLKRFAVRANQDQMVFEIDKESPGEELIALDYYFAEHACSPREIRVHVETAAPITPNTAMNAWSCHDNVFLIHPPHERQRLGYVLGRQASANRILHSQRCFVFLGENVPTGPVRLHLTGANAGDDYLVVSRVTPGDYEQRQISVRDTKSD